MTERPVALSPNCGFATMIQRIADDFQSIAASLKKLERDKEAAVNRPAQANERLIREADEARERAKKLPPGPERDALLKKACQAESPNDGFPRPNWSRQTNIVRAVRTRAIFLITHICPSSVRCESIKSGSVRGSG